MTIEIVNTFYGKRYAVVAPFKSTSTVKDAQGNYPTRVENLAVEYKNGSRVEVAVFPLTKEGLKKAKEVKNNLKAIRK